MSRAIFAFSQISKVVITFAITVIPTMGLIPIPSSK